MKIIVLKTLVLITAITTLCSHASVQNRALEEHFKYSFVAFESNSIIPLTIAGRLSKPNDVDGLLPAVIIVHGSGGVDERGTIYSKALNSIGFATLEIDMWSARGLEGGLSRPKHVNETLPDIEAAVTYLKSRKDIDEHKLGLIGFSWGGVVAMLTSRPDKIPEIKALVANYPVCWAYNKVPGYSFQNVAEHKRLMIVSAQDDKYDGPKDCKNLISQLPEHSKANVTLKSLANATHAFELPRPDSIFFDPYAYQGKGGDVPLKYNPEATLISTQLSSQFFIDHLQ
ncbi:dienelactone hydrolase family protein [Vibrio gigantis]|uniref:dienelactone hydrolase family protein n=1 Tax=Vibrio gigantis TaxID=296199 RepID=UPI001BFD01D2|nr:dienelactone hydrolase family protein [Vibrio gigantis]